MKKYLIASFWWPLLLLADAPYVPNDPYNPRFEMIDYLMDPSLSYALVFIKDKDLSMMYYYMIDSDESWSENKDLMEFIVWHTPFFSMYCKDEPKNWKEMLWEE